MYNIVEKGEKMNKTKMMYILISAFCLFAIIAGIYAQFVEKNGNTNIANENKQNEETKKTQEEIKADFNDLFTSTLNLNGYDTTGIQKINPGEEVVYSAYDIEEQTEAYEVNMHIPVINIKSELTTTLNQITQANFINKANEILQKTDTTNKTIFSIDYVAYINSNILSLIIRSTLKEGSSAQRVIIQTYNYNLSTNTQATLVDLINIKMLNKDEVNDKILEVVTKANEEDKALQNMGYNEIFVRDLTSNMYNIDNAGSYFLGPNEELYIVYPYGNNEFTSKMDIVLFE